MDNTIDYYAKYKKYKHKYFSIKGGKPNKNAIVMLCFLKEHYVIGACIAGYLHKQFIKKNNFKIDIIIMCDTKIYDKHNTILKKYFDSVIKINMRYFEPSSKYIYAKKKYSEWIGYSLNKWQCLQFTEYNKVLFIDIDILPKNRKFYDIFDYKTPAIYINQYNKYDFPISRLSDTNIPKISHNITFDEYVYNVNEYGTLNGGLILLKPDIKIYNEYVKLTDRIFKDGIYSIEKSGPDETSLFYYYLSKGKQIYNVADEYTVVPWDEINNITCAKSYNFLSYIKPWTKIKLLAWPEERLWIYIYDNMPKSNKIKSLYKNIIKESLKEYNNYSFKRKKRYYNIKYIKELEKVKDSFDKVLELDKKMKINNFGILKTKEIENILT